MAYFRCMTGDSSVILGGMKVTKNRQYVKHTVSLPARCGNSSIVVYNDELHLIGASYHPDATDDEIIAYAHYKWTGVEWVRLNDLPFNYTDAMVTVYNNEIHALARHTYSAYVTEHYKFDGSSWVEDIALPISIMQFYGSMFSYRGELHVIGQAYTAGNGQHFKFTGSSWVEVSTPPYEMGQSAMIVYNDAIHVIGCYYSEYAKAHYKWTPESGWVRLSDLSRTFMDKSATVIYDNKLYLIGGDWENLKGVNIFDGSSWTTSSSVLPIAPSSKRVVNYRNHIMFCDYETNLWKWDGDGKPFDTMYSVTIAE